MDKLVIILDCDFGDGSIERKILEAHGFQLEFNSGDTESADTGLSENCVAVITQYMPVTRELLRKHPSIRAVVRYGVGLDVIDTSAAEEFGVNYGGVADYCTDEVADHMVALLLSSTRSVSVSNGLIKTGVWPKPMVLPLMVSLRTQTVGLVGFGRIAQGVAARLRGFGCTILAHDQYLSDAEIADKGGIPATLDEALRANIVSLHLPATSETKGLINSNVLSVMQRGSVLVNVSRGSLLDEEAVMNALDSGQLAMACLDVFEEESPTSLLTQHPRVIATPHSGYFSERALRALRSGAANRVVELLEAAES